MSSPAGWYPQPDGQLRYWDGQHWTDHLAPGSAQPLPAGAARAPSGSPTRLASSAPASGRRLGRASRYGWGGLALAALLGAVDGGVSGSIMMFALFTFTVGVIALVRGRVGWARIRTRAAGAAVLVVSMVALVTIGAVAAPAPSTVTDAARIAGAASRPSSSTPSPSSLTKPPPATPAPAVKSPKASAEIVTPKPIAVPPPQQSGGDSLNAAGAILPNAARTPGALNPAVNQADIGQTICVPGWTKTVRPPSSLTTQLKVQQLASGYAYKGDTATGDYEEDHLISLELGGAPSAQTNLWPEPYNTPEGARVKDRVENKLHTLVCEHGISLATAQHAIASNWWTAYQTYVGTTTTTLTPATSARTSTSAPASTPAPVAPGNGATALCNDGTYSYAAHHQGACSHHGGVRVFYK